MSRLPVDRLPPGHDEMSGREAGNAGEESCLVHLRIPVLGASGLAAPRINESFFAAVVQQHCFLS